MADIPFLKVLSDAGGKAVLDVPSMATDQYFKLPSVGGPSGAPVLLGGGGGDMLQGIVNPQVDITTTGTATLSSWNHCTATSADYTVTLPTVSGNAGKFIGIWIDPTSTKLVTIKGNAAETIDGSNTRIMWANETAVLYCDGTKWAKVAGKSIPMSGTLGFTSNQTYANNTNALLTWTTSLDLSAPAAFQTAATARMTALRPGRYAITICVGLNNTNNTFSVVQATAVKNAVTSLDVAITIYSAASFDGLQLKKEAILTTGDYIQPYFYYAAGSFGTSICINDNATPQYNFFTLTEVCTW